MGKLVDYEIGLVTDLFASDYIQITIINYASANLSYTLTNDAGLTISPESGTSMDQQTEISVWGDTSISTDVHITINLTDET